MSKKSLTTVLTCKVDVDLAAAVKLAAMRAGTSTSALLRRITAQALEHAEWPS